MKQILKIIVNTGYSIIFYCMIFVISTISVGISLKGKPQYLSNDKTKTPLNIVNIIEEYVDEYTIENKNNTTYVYTTSKLPKEKLIALYMQIYLNKKEDNYDIQIMNESLLDESITWASITDSGVSIS